jgi:phage regulator Rha-like protein
MSRNNNRSTTIEDFHINSMDASITISGEKTHHQYILKAIIKIISDDDIFSKKVNGDNIVYSNDENKITFEESKYLTSMNNSYTIFNMNKGGYLLLINNLGRYKGAKRLQLDSIGYLLILEESLKEKDNLIADLIEKNQLEL